MHSPRVDAHAKKGGRCLSLALIPALVLALSSEAAVPERRKPQFETDPGYYIFPTPYSLPGIGEGAAAIGAGMNIGGTYTDALGFALMGDMQGAGIVTKDVHIVPRRLVFDVTVERLSAATITSYGARGMSTDKHDFSLLELDDVNFLGSRLTATFWERRLEFFGGGYLFGTKIDRVLDADGSLILDVQDPPANRARIIVFGTRLDFTDDYADPRRGARLEVSRWRSPPKEQRNPDYYFMEYNASVYVPFGRRNTWVFNYFRSDAHVTLQGETDLNVIQQQEGLNCSDPTLTPQEQADCLKIVNNIRDANTYGTVGSFGGTSRLRSYPNDRFTGAHAVFYGTEFRWNLTEERQPFNIYIMKDIRTVWQLAFFYEVGSVADRRDELGDIGRSSYGAGLRMVTASGVVFRADVAAGKEGVETTIIVGYPWEAL